MRSTFARLLCHTLAALLLSPWAAGAQPVAGAPPTKRIAITIDDLPMASATPSTLAELDGVHAALRVALKRHSAPAVGFVNEDQLLRRGELDQRVGLLDAWLEAGLELGNHGYGHPSLWQLPLDRYEQAVLQGEVFTRWLTAARGLPLRYWRHPYTQTGKTEEEKAQFERFLADHGYQAAPFTVDHDDHMFACVYDKLGGPERARVADAYLLHFERALDAYESMSEQLFQRQIAQVLLIHASRLNATALERLLLVLERRGYAFITLEDALKDPAYRSRDLASGKFGPSWLTRWARERKQKLSVYGAPDPSGWVAEQHQRLCQN